MLNHGADLGETTTLIDGIAKSEGLQTMKNLVKIQDDKQKIEALTQVAGKIRIKFPHFPKSQQAMVNKTKEWAAKKNLQPVQPLTASHFELIPDVFRNEDKTVPSIKTSMTTGMSGIILLDHDAAAPWISEPTIVSSDECGVIVLGHKCPSNDPKRCCKIQIPVKSSNSQTAIVAACLHNVGQKKICVFKDENIEKIDVKKGAILAITIFRDELQVDEWEFVSQHPVKFALQSIGFGDESFFLGAPWGRSWISQGKKCQPIAAASVQFHVRVDESKVELYMKASGSNGVYITPKTSNNVVDPNFAIIWVDMTPIELTQLLVKYPQHLGIVRVTKEKSSTVKTSRGVRCKRDDFAAFFQQLRPGDTLPDTTPIQCLYKIQPIPVGAKVEDIAKWMKLHSWEGRPIKALNDRTWLVGSKVSFNREFLFWNEQSVLIKPVQSKAQHPISPVVAGHIPRQAEKPSGTSSANGSDPWNKTDPWARYTPVSSNASVVQPRTAAPPAATRSVDAPTEARFQQQGEKVSQLAEAVKELQTKFDKREEESTRFEAQVHNEFALVRSEVSNQFSSMSKGFQVSMEKALEKQDRQMSQSFLELKQLIRMNNQPNPAKKAKAKHHVEDIEVDQEGDQHGDHCLLVMVQNMVDIGLKTIILCMFNAIAVGLPHQSLEKMKFSHISLQNILEVSFWGMPSKYRILQTLLSHESNMLKFFRGAITTNCDLILHRVVCVIIQSIASLDVHCPMRGVRIGEAANPGPQRNKNAEIRIAVCNPHAIRSHKYEILQLQSEIVFVAESSATRAVQSEFQNNIAKNGFHCYWSPPVDSKYQTDQNEFSLRGEPLGTVVLTKLPSRKSRIQISQDLLMTNRISMSVINVGGIDTLCISLYGYAKKCHDGRRLNDLLLARVFNIVNETRMPYIIGGDFNEPPMKLPSWQSFEEFGAFEAHNYYQIRFQLLLPPTCRGATYNDTFIFHPFFVVTSKTWKLITNFRWIRTPH